MNPNDMLVVDAWLVREGYKEPTVPTSAADGQQEPSIKPYTRQIITELRRLADDLESPRFDDETKAQKFQTFIRAMWEGIADGEDFSTKKRSKD